jgi:predicted transglutaminase-like cysteine proteinase
MRSHLSIAFVLAGILLPAPAAADPLKSHRGQDRAASFMRVYGPTLRPYGFVRFCESNPRECRQGALEETRFSLANGRMAELDEVNRAVNKAIEPASDLELYGETERWTIPTTKGDCEDYALLKRKILIERGWPVSALLMTVVRDEKGEGHAILTARTAQGDFVLDNKNDEIKPWHKVGYTYVMRQSYIDPRVWVSLDPKDAQSPALLAGVRSAR